MFEFHGVLLSIVVAMLDRHTAANKEAEAESCEWIFV